MSAEQPPCAGPSGARDAARAMRRQVLGGALWPRPLQLLLREVRGGLLSAGTHLLWPDPSGHLEPESHVVGGIADGWLVGRTHAPPRATRVQEWGGGWSGAVGWSRRWLRVQAFREQTFCRLPTRLRGLARGWVRLCSPGQLPPTSRGPEHKHVSVPQPGEVLETCGGTAGTLLRAGKPQYIA